jgi:hypothetical protein
VVVSSLSLERHHAANKVYRSNNLLLCVPTGPIQCSWIFFSLLNASSTRHRVIRETWLEVKLTEIVSNSTFAFPSIFCPSMCIGVIHPSNMLQLPSMLTAPTFAHNVINIGRDAGTLVIACLCVATLVLDPAAAFAAVASGLPTLALLFASMVMSAYMEREGAGKKMQSLMCRGLTPSLPRQHSSSSTSSSPYQSTRTNMMIIAPLLSRYCGYIKGCRTECVVVPDGMEPVHAAHAAPSSSRHLAILPTSPSYTAHHLLLLRVCLISA